MYLPLASMVILPLLSTVALIFTASSLKLSAPRLFSIFAVLKSLTASAAV